ncbi:conserved hypothetical protein [Ricinus communis]|uniref:F-box domain-containing protein n=1 Tax=Ricinus communis TaxID=3988 RepID=B9S8D9_RICCO|nr:conserved hypothetical protein [Ricinus communis]|eukprot:XP_002522258.1 F-box/kelch-repeat protein At3g23880 [Ricinus communis]
MTISLFNRLLKGKTKREAAGRPYIPHDIILSILLRLPVKSIIRFKAVHSSWLSLISSPEFSFRHLHHERACFHKHGVIQIRNRHTAYPCLSLRSSFDTAAEDVDRDHDLVDIQNPFGEVYHSTYIRAEVLGSCNGLLLVCLIHRDRRSREFLLWNPSTREHEKISCNYYSPLTNIVGLGYDEFNDNYKIVDVSFKRPGEAVINVYNLKERCWEIKNYDFPYKVYYYQPGTTLANGIPHWLVLRRVNYASVVLLSFDVVEEKFKEVPLPAAIKASTYISTLYGYLCMGDADSREIWMVWIMREYGVGKSWIKLNISFPEPPEMPFLYRLIPHEFINKDRVVMSIDWMTLVIYSPSRKEYKNVLISDQEFSVATYAESCIS